MRLPFALALLAAVSCCSTGSLTDTHRSVASMVREGALVVDTRTSAEFEIGHVEGAVNIPFNETLDNLEDLPRDRPVVFYCLSGHRSAAAAQTLRSEGYTDVHDAGRYRCLKKALATSVSDTARQEQQ